MSKFVSRPVFLFICMSVLNRQETVEQLLSNIFDREKNESAIVSVIQILLTLFETRRPAYVLWSFMFFSTSVLVNMNSLNDGKLYIKYLLLFVC